MPPPPRPTRQHRRRRTARHLPCAPPTSAAGTPSPRILRGANPSPLGCSRALSAEEKFFSDSPPPPPRHGRSAYLDDEIIPETPDPATFKADLRPDVVDQPVLRPQRASYADAVRRGVNAPHTAAAMHQPQVNHRGCNPSPDVTRARPIQSGEMANPRKIWRPRQAPAMPAGSPELEPGWTPAEHRRRTFRRPFPPPRRDG
jgi:hypothetical protein